MTYENPRKLFPELILLYSILVLPLSVHAGFFSIFFKGEPASVPEEVVYASEQNAQTVPLLRAAINIDPNPAKGGGDIIVDNGVLIPSGDISGKEEKVNTKTQNGEISVYIVREGDTLSEIAIMYDVSSKTILWANNISSANAIRPGDELVILPITGVRHVVKKGDTIQSIAKKYEGDVDDILAYNQLTSAEEIQVGDTIIIPDGTVSAPAPAKGATPRGSGGTTGGGGAGFKHPVPGAVRTQGIHGYNGVDFGGAVGTPIYAAAGGEVIVSKSSGWNGGYGLYVVVKHGNGTQTLYAHLSRTAVAVGSSVAQGQVIGYMGSTGRSTGTHLHFEVRGARNPF